MQVYHFRKQEEIMWTPGHFASADVDYFYFKEKNKALRKLGDYHFVSPEQVEKLAKEIVTSPTGQRQVFEITEQEFRDLVIQHEDLETRREQYEAAKAKFHKRCEEVLSG